MEFGSDVRESLATAGNDTPIEDHHENGTGQVTEPENQNPEYITVQPAEGEYMAVLPSARSERKDVAGDNGRDVKVSIPRHFSPFCIIYLHMYISIYIVVFPDVIECC